MMHCTLSKMVDLNLLTNLTESLTSLQLCLLVLFCVLVHRIVCFVAGGVKPTSCLSSTLNAYTSGLKFPDLQNYPTTTKMNSSDLLTSPPSSFNPSGT